jgi:chromosome segregation ATPase
MPVFGEDQKRKGAVNPVPVVNEIVGRVNDNTKRLRLLEQREKLLTSRITSMDESVGAKLEALESAGKELDARIAALDEKVSTVHNTLKEVVKQLQFLVKRSEMKKVEEKLKLFEPILAQLGKQMSEQQGG